MMKGGLDSYISGDNWLIDDRSGARIRRSESRKEWNGAIVHEDDFEERHPLDFIKGRRDNQTVPDPRPEPEAVFLGPKSTTISEAAAAGDTSITVASTTGFAAGHSVAIMLDDRTRHLATVATVVDATHLTLDAALPWQTSADQAVIDYGAVTAPDIG